MRCASCRSQMIATDWGKVQGHVCPNCYGVWLAHKDKWNLLGTSAVVPQGRLKTALALKCPECKTVLTKASAGDQYNRISAQVCTGCKGMFLNKVDFRLLKKKHKRHKQKSPDEITNDEYYEKFEEDRDIEISDYLFSIFTGFPVEINVPPQKPPVVSVSLICINVVIFLVSLSALHATVQTWGFKPSSFQFTTLFTCMFLHAGWGHLIGNMYFLYVFGDNVEDRLGKVNYIIFYLLCGLIATAAYYLANAGGTIPVVGASGAISGLMGAYLLACTKAKIGMVFLFIPIKMPAFCYFFIWVVFQIVLSYGRTNVAWEAHLGGFVAGLVLYPILKSLKSDEEN